MTNRHDCPISRRTFWLRLAVGGAIWVIAFILVGLVACIPFLVAWLVGLEA